MLQSSPLVSIVLLASLATFGACQDTDLNTVKSAFDSANIPGNATINFDPTILFEVVFPQAEGTHVNVSAGMQVTANQTAIAPIFGISQSNVSATVDGTFVVAMVDLDAPTPQNASAAQIRHFLGGNFFVGDPDSSGMGIRILYNTTTGISEYQQPSPPDGSDVHRYVFLLFNQTADFNNQTEVNSTTPISNFNISQFAQEVGLGDPLGGTFIFVASDSST